MTSFFYQAGIQALKAAMSVGALFSSKMRLGVEGRKGLQQKLRDFRNRIPADAPVAWFHAASLGEFEQGRPVMEAFRKQYPDYYIVLSFFSPSGYEVRKNYAGADFICYIPFDTVAGSKWFLEILKPAFAFFIKYEFWYNFLKELRSRNCHIISFSAIFRPGQIFFKPYGGFYRSLLSCFDHIHVQNEESLALLHQVGIRNCSVAGDTRFDRVMSIASAAAGRPEIVSFMDDRPRLVAGSVWGNDMEVLVPVLNQTRGRLKAIIAPHEIRKEQISMWVKSLDGKAVLYSELSEHNLAMADYLIIDNIGMLSSLYRYGDMAFIGGSFGAGLHNILEAATFGLPVIFGAKGYHKFQEAKDLIALKGAVAVSDTGETLKQMEGWISNPEQMRLAGSICAGYVAQRTGATDAVMGMVAQLIKK
ncbi:3-deoxy-D-manno-octulosonic acid transferase [Dyadobacter sp. CECT 9275]|uniref:3-deoxy-D-manno-octulosonic acid transferase n=1 Tax=Dyadobacter helix TaxID=2822344 RepID=A0A916J9X7_9BACT|nr:glycosyltransferase N-terminal domain-containing protein [Dyadobacter sp. CECT 9275]CAG4989761.1 3-deoxy-D-manno-octulosonic acid transferase [Dyadobacter sp. CECT 9275]